MIGTVRLTLGVLGLVTAVYGVRLLLAHPGTELVDLALWLVGGVLAHDLVLAPLTVVVSLLGLRLVPPRARAPMTAGLVVLGTVTLTAIPVLLSLGARPDNPTLLDRNYTLGWLELAAVVAGGVALTMVVRRKPGSAGASASRARWEGRTDGQGDGGR